MRNVFLFLAVASLLPLSALAAPKNIIYMIGDGMGPSYVAAYRYYQHDPATAVVANTVYDDLLTGMASTYPDDDTLVTDSAASATALATGFKSYNGAISVNRQHIPIGTMMQLAKRLGKANGIVASSQVNHATPASFLAHNQSRRNMNEIADMYLDYRIDGKPVADLIIGGGTKYFVREDRNLIAGFTELGYQYTDDYKQLDSLTRLPAIALLAETALPAVLNSGFDSMLGPLTEKALQLLSTADKGFVLMVEGSQIDWCGHDNDIACAMAEMHDFAAAIKVAKAYVDANPDTLLIITADHETGGLSLGANGVYEWRTEVIKQVKVTGPEIAKSDVETAIDIIEGVLNDHPENKELIQKRENLEKQLKEIESKDDEQAPLVPEAKKSPEDMSDAANKLMREGRYSEAAEIYNSGRPDTFTLTGATVQAGGRTTGPQNKTFTPQDRTPASIEFRSGVPGRNRVSATWIVTGSGTVTLEYSSLKGGVHRRTVELR